MATREGGHAVPVKRRVPKIHNFNITPELVELYRRALAAEELHTSTIRGEVEITMEEREAMIETSLVFRRAVGVSIGDVSPTDPDILGPIPDYMVKGNLWAARSWDRAVAIRRALDAALRKARR